MLTTPYDRPTPYGKKHNLGHTPQKNHTSPRQGTNLLFPRKRSRYIRVWQVFWLVLPLSRPSHASIATYSDHETDCGMCVMNLQQRDCDGLSPYFPFDA